MRYAVHAASVLSIVNIGTSFVVILFQKNPRAHFIIYHCLQCYEYLMISVKLFQIVVSVLDLVPKSHVPLTIARLRLTIFNGTWDLETTSKTLSRISEIEIRVASLDFFKPNFSIFAEKI